MFFQVFSECFFSSFGQRVANPCIKKSSLSQIAGWTNTAWWKGSVVASVAIRESFQSSQFLGHLYGFSLIQPHEWSVKYKLPLDAKI
jgi:hypothetical protein